MSGVSVVIQKAISARWCEGGEGDGGGRCSGVQECFRNVLGLQRLKEEAKKRCLSVSVSKQSYSHFKIGLFALCENAFYLNSPGLIYL